jgi:ribonuclease E
MAKRMLIDATHPEETRVVVISGNRLDEFDFESSTKKQLKGNIYLAKVVRVEPSLQAAFVDYAGNRHGFLAFNEIHPDYYRIPIADRQALIKEDASLAKQSAADEGDEAGGLEIVGGDEAEEVERRRPKVLRSYKIQEVIKRRQILLVQVVKEERGNKGAALTTYLSLAGRYCVLMPNTARGGGISRKITNPKDRKRLKAIVEELKIPDELAVIVRTAGSERTKAEIKRDYEYLNRLWDEIRELTLKSTAPALIYEEANIIKRAVRDLYTKEIDEILVDGDEGYKTAKAFMKMMIPSHARKVKPADDPAIPLFHRYQVESQLDAIHNPTVQLRSGGYIVLNPTEALVSIDVNSGRATRERHIEETALKTNIEAAEEIARQLRLRDLAGLIVIDFIDMEETKNIVAVERRLKEAMRHDRARIQIGRISPFGLLELSRQRLRPSLVEASTLPCRHCGGTGHVRSTESTALHILRAIEEEGIRGRSAEITAYVPTAVALYVLNQKRERLGEIEGRYRFRVFVASDDELIPPDFRIERVKAEGGGGGGGGRGAAGSRGRGGATGRRRGGGRGGGDPPPPQGASPPAEARGSRAGGSGRGRGRGRRGAGGAGGGRADGGRRGRQETPPPRQARRPAAHPARGAAGRGGRGRRRNAAGRRRAWPRGTGCRAGARRDGTDDRADDRARGRRARPRRGGRGAGAVRRNGAGDRARGRRARPRRGGRGSGPRAGAGGRSGAGDRAGRQADTGAAPTAQTEGRGGARSAGRGRGAGGERTRGGTGRRARGRCGAGARGSDRRAASGPRQWGGIGGGGRTRSRSPDVAQARPGGPRAALHGRHAGLAGGGGGRGVARRRAGRGRRGIGATATARLVATIHRVAAPPHRAARRALGRRGEGAPFAA